MTEEEFKNRTKAFAAEIIRLVDELPSKNTARIIGGQLVRSATSIGANYRSACRAKSKADFVAKLAIVEEEADETIYWLELLILARYVDASRVNDLLKEAEVFVRISVSSIRTIRSQFDAQSKIQNLNSKINRGVTQADKGDRL